MTPYVRYFLVLNETPGGRAVSRLFRPPTAASAMSPSP